MVTATDAVFGMTFTGVGWPATWASSPRCPPGPGAVALADAEMIAAGPPLALAGIKAMLTLWPADPRKTLEREVDLAVALMDTEDFAEGIAALGEHRKPVFRGR